MPFYDLNRTGIHCPNCGALFDASIVLHARKEQSSATPGKRAGRGAHAFAARQSVVKPQPPKLDEDEDSESTTGEAINADDDTLPLEEDADDEIADVVMPPGDDRADR